MTALKSELVKKNKKARSTLIPKLDKGEVN